MKPFAFVALVLLMALSDSLASQSSPPLQNAQALMKEGRVSEAIPLLLELHRAQPRHSGVCQQLGIAYTQLEQFTQATEFYRKALLLDPRLLPARKNLGVVLWFSEHKTEAENEFNRVLTQSPNEPVAHFYLGMLGHERKQYAKARNHFLKAGGLALDNPEAFSAVLETALSTKDRMLTDALLSSAEKSANKQPDVWFQAGTLLGRFGSYEQAIRAFERIREIYPERDKLFQNLGLAQLQARRFTDAVSSFEALLRLRPSSSEAYLWLAEASDGAGDPQKAYDAYAKAIEKDSKSEQAYAALSNFAVAHYNTPFALKVLGQGLQSVPGSARLLLQQGVIQALDDKMTQAEQSFLQASQALPGWPLPSLALGLAQLQTGKLSEAIRSFQTAADIAKDDYRPNYLIALALVRGGGQNQPGRHADIVAVLQKAVKLNPSHAESHALLGQTYLANNQLDLALQELKRATELQPENATALYQLAMAYRKKGQTALSREFLRKFEALKQREKQDDDLAKKELIQMLKVNQER